MNMILKQLLNGRQHSDFIVIKDSLNISALKLLELFIQNNLDRGSKVTFFMFENANYDFNHAFVMNKNFTAINCFDDPWNWFGQGAPKSSKLEEMVNNKSFLENTLNVIIIDSLAYLLFQMDIHSLCLTLRTIFESNSETQRCQLITVLHMHYWPDDSIEFKQINCLAKSVIALVHNQKKNINLINTEHRKSSGKIIIEEYICSLDSDGKFKFEVHKNIPKDNPTTEINPMNLTTFKLALEDHEKETRSRVVLPYVKTEEKTGKIFYVPDANDDWDEEDPDDDLEI